MERQGLGLDTCSSFPQESAKRRPAHKKTNWVFVTVLASVAVVFATAGVSVAAVPQKFGVIGADTALAEAPIVESADAAAVAEETADADGSATEEAAAVLLAAPGQPQPADFAEWSARCSAAAQGTLRSAGEAVSHVREAGAPEKAREDDAVWHEGWDEQVEHPAVYERSAVVEMYLCSGCGFTTESYADMCQHVSQEDGAEIMPFVQGGAHFLVSEAWTETIHHEGHWE